MSYNPEKTLWQEVLLRQVEDALHGPTGVSGQHNRIAKVRSARTFLTTPNDSLVTVCSLAGLDHEAVISRMRKQIANAPSPEDLTTKPRAHRASFTARPEKPKATLTKYVDRLLTFDDTTLTMQQWADRTGLTVTQIASRLRQHWTIERALTQPMRKRNRGWGATGAASGTDAPGLGSDFRPLEGTGAGRSAQDRPNLSFSERVLN
ncbi:hypothetical protein [Ruegeria sp. PrR005]|uniref:Uncharacterized protein n=1 Tax=Ruegeria sp. PrR005 TaxID=2706882 RepID=A0A6B2NJR1_9RHOB|nr:hypothetical protein [Ruegeria sp. PrR005]NDW43658.1 hypothetical protein [Ruegeria sp. PrR005]